MSLLLARALRPRMPLKGSLRAFSDMPVMPLKAAQDIVTPQTTQTTRMHGLYDPQRNLMESPLCLARSLVINVVSTAIAGFGELCSSSSSPGAREKYFFKLVIS